MAEKSNQWAAKEWRDAVRIAVNEPGPSGFKKLRLLADKLVATALEGDVTALKEIGDRLDGKVPQGIGGDPDNPLMVAVTKIALVAPQVGE